MGIFPFFTKKLIKGSVKGIENKTVSHRGSVIKNLVFYNNTKSSFKFIEAKIAEYVEYLEKSKKTDDEKKLEKLGLTSSKSYGYNLNLIDEEYLNLMETYKEKYHNNIYIPEKLFTEIGLKKVYKKDFKYTIPSEIIDVLYSFKVDSEDYKIYEYAQDDYGCRIPISSPFTYKDIETAINAYWTTNYKEKYLTHFKNGERTFLGSGRESEKNLLSRLKEMNSENYSIKEHYTAEINFFFLISNPDDRKKTFKEFIGESESVENEVFVMQPVRGGYLLMGNW